MTENLQHWADEHHLIISELQINGSDIIACAIGKLLYVKPTDGKIIDESFGFILTDEEFTLLESGEVDYILFEFGGMFYYSPLTKDVNKYNEEIYKTSFNDFKYIGTTSEPAVVEFAHLGIHTEYELLNGSGSSELWCKKAKFMGVKALGICDKNTLAGALCFQTSCENEGIKSIIGETISVAVNYDPDVDNQEIFELKLYVLNYEGWKNLLLVNKAINVDYDGYIPDTLLYTLGKGLCCVIPKESHLNYIKNDYNAAVKLIARYKRSFDKVFYQIDTVEYVSSQLFKRHLENIDVYLCKYSKLVKPILINDSYYLDKEESGLKLMLNKVAGRASAESNNQYFKSVGETINSYEEWLDDVEPLSNVIISGLENSSELSNTITFKINSGERKLPKYEIEDVEGLFFEELEKGFNEHFGNLSKKEQEPYIERLETECKVIVPNGLCDYFMIMWDILNHCHENGVMTGPGRGSVCGSLVAYCLHITQVDPLKYNLLFERFLNETRVSGERAKSADSMPDVDEDFPAEYRDWVKEYIKDKYGYAYTCSIGTYTRMKLKTCIKDFGKVKGLSFDYTNKLTKDIDDQIEYTWDDLIKYASRSKALFKFVQENPELVHLCKYALQQPKAESVHPSAVVIVPKYTNDGKPIDLWEWLPVKKIDGVLVSEWEGKYIDKSGFLKEDILGLSQLDKFSNMLKLIKENTGEDINLNEIPLDEEKVFKYFRRGWNEDVFQFGTTGLMNYCRQVKPTCLEDLIAMTALFRPGPMDVNAHQDYVDIRTGKKKLVYDFGMEEITKETYGLYVYQEQIMQAAVVGGLSKVDSDNMRTAIKKKKIDVLESYGNKFKQGYIKLLNDNDVTNTPEEYAERVWEKLLAFSGYGFNKSHAAAYSIISYWSQWFKVFYPLEFWTTTLQFSKENEVPFRLAELKKTGVEIEVRPPDINYSGSTFTCDSNEDRIFFSLNKIKSVGDTAVSNIMSVREEGGMFFSLEEFLQRIKGRRINKTVVKMLIIAGAFDLIESLSSPSERKKLLRTYMESVGDNMPDEYNTADSNSNAFWILEQRKITGFGEVDYETMIHEFIPNKRIADKYVSDSEFLSSRTGIEVTVAGKLIYYKEKEIKNGTMCTIELDCNNTLIPILLWPDAYEKLPEPVEQLKGCTVAINGEVKNDKFKNEKKIYSMSSTRLYVLKQG
jgi:DNA polymerase III subunit alpha